MAFPIGEQGAVRGVRSGLLRAATEEEKIRYRDLVLLGMDPEEAGQEIARMIEERIKQYTT